MAYCSASDVRDVARLDITASTSDAGISAIIDAVCLRIDQFSNLPEGGYAVTVDTTRNYNWDHLHNGQLHLDMSLLSLTTLTNGDGSALPTGSYRLYPRNTPQKWFIGLLSGYGWGMETDGEIIVTGKFGHSLIVPPNVAEAATMWSAYLVKRYQAALQDATANQELGQLVYSEAIPKQVLALLRPRGAML